MAVPTNTVQTAAQVSVREQLADIIYNVDPTETPILTGMSKGKATNVFSEWTKENLVAPNADNASIQGDDIVADAASVKVRLGNYTQLSDKAVSISSTSDAVNTAGRKTEMSREIKNRGLEMRRDMEAAILSANPSVAPTAGVAGKLGGIGAWLETNTSFGATGSAGGFNTGTGIVDAPTAGTDRAFTETLVKGVIQDIWAGSSGKGEKIALDGALKQKFSGFSGIATQYRENSGVKQATILGAADIYVSDFGQHTVVPCRQMPAKTVYLLTQKHWELQTLQGMKVEKLAKTGHSNKRMLSCEYTLCSKNEESSGGIFAVDPAL